MTQEDGKSHTVAIVVAVIGVVGVLGSALIANWDKVIAPRAAPTITTRPAEPTTGTTHRTPTAQSPAAQAAAPEAPIATSVPAEASPPSDTQDSVKVLSITPNLNSVLPSNRSFAITMRLQYRLVSADSILIVPFLEQFGPGDKCASGNHRTIGSTVPDRIPVKRGEGEVAVVIRVDADQHSDLGGTGFVAPQASFWAGFDSRHRVITLQEQLWEFRKYCYRFAPA